MTPCSDKSLLLHALADGELDAANAAQLEAHVTTCAGCAEALAKIANVRAMVSAEPAHRKAPAQLRLKVESLLQQATQPSQPASRPAPAPRWRRSPGFVGGAATAIAASLALFVALPQLTSTSLADQVVADHVRSLLSAHLTDVATSDRHVVKPWFNGKIDFAPPVIDLVDRGFPLVGGRLDYLDGRVVPALVFHRRLHSINLFIRPITGLASPIDFTTTRGGYSLARWRQGDLEYWAVSDIAPSELTLFRREFFEQAREKPGP